MRDEFGAIIGATRGGLYDWVWEMQFSLPECRVAVAILIGLTLSCYSIHAADFPKPDAAKAFADLKIYDAQGRPYRAAMEDWVGAKKLVAEDPNWALWLKDEQRAVDGWMAKHRDRVEWNCGWSHDFVSPKNGSRISWTDKIPGEEVQTFSSPSDPAIEITPKLMAAWVFGFRGRHADMMERAAELYRLTGETKYAEWAAGQLDFYAEHYQDWKPQHDGARLYWQTLDEASYGIRYVNTARLLGDYVTAERKQMWWDKFFQPVATVLNGSFQKIHNIATWQRAAVAQIALLYGDEALWKDALDSKYGLRCQMAQGVTSDYIWWEQSLGYNSFLLAALRNLFIVAGISGRAEELGGEMTVAENLMFGPMVLRFPDDHLPNPADSTGMPMATNKGPVTSMYRVFPTKMGLSEAATQHSWDTLLDPPAAIAPIPDISQGVNLAVASRSLESTRMALLKAGPWQVFLHYGQLTNSHSQAEALNFSAYYGNTDVTHDPGTVGYGSPLHKEYYTRGLNHNVPLVNGEGEEPPQPGELLAFSADPAKVTAAQPKYRSDAKAERTLAIEGDTLTDTATIETTLKEPQKLGLALHLQGKVKLPEGFQPDANFAAGRPASFGYWRDVSGATGKDKMEFDVEYKEVTLHVTMAVPGEFKIWHGSTPDAPPERRPGLYMETSGTKAVFVTTFGPKK